MQDSSVQVKQETHMIGPSLPSGFMKQEHMETETSGNVAEETSAAVAAIGSEIPQQGTESLSTSTGVITANYVAGTEGEGLGTIGPLVSEMSHGDEVVQAAEEFERRSRKMKDHLTIKAEAEPGPSKREEWMTELPPEMGKNFGLTTRTFSKGTGSDSKDRSDWTDTPADKVKKERDGKSKKRKKDETVEKNISKRDAQLQQQVEEYNKKKRPESLVEMHQKHKKKKKTSSAQNQTQTVAESTQVQPTVQHSTQVQTQTQTIQHLTPQQQQQLQQQVVAAGGDQMQFLQLPDEIRESLDLLSDQKTSEYYSGEFQQTEFNEGKPLADLLLNQNMVGYSQDGTVFSQGGAVFSTSQMIAQAYNQAQQLSTASLSQHPIFATSLAGQVGPNMGITIIPAPLQEGQTTLQDGQTSVTDDSQTAGAVQALSGTYAGTITSQASSISAFPLGQNVIIASPSTQQGNFIFTSSGQAGGGIGQNIVIAAPGQQGSYLVKQETQEELAQTLVLASQNAQQTLGHNVIMASSSTPQTATLSDGSSVVLAHSTPSGTPTSEGQGGGKTVSISSKSLHPTASSISAAAAGLQAQGSMQPVSLVLPPVNSIFPQLQNIQSQTTSPNFIHLSAKMDKMIIILQETAKSLADTNKRLERIESHLSMTPPSSSKSKKSKSSSSSSSSSTTTATAATSSSTSTTPSGPAPSKSELKAALADYLTITDFSNTDELRRNDSSSDLFIPVGTVSLPIQEPPSPSFSEASGETATSTVSELPDQNLLVLNDPNTAIVTTPELTAPDSQSGIAVTIYDSEGGTYELGPDSSKDNAVGRFTTVSQNPKTVIVDPKFWEMLVEDFQKNMTSKQIMSALANVRKPLVRNMGNNEISICSTVLKEAEEACQGRRERLAKELVFRIFTLGEVYDRNVSGVFYIKGKKMENKHKALDPAKMSAIRFLVMRYPPSVLDNPRLEKLVWKNCVDRINDALRRIYNWIHKLVDINSIVDKLPTDSILQSSV
ncbi:uncharacterized protein LOC112554972 isoform X2 [Pomacea canaliculata]|nr:uncharacterized protein LOC112554972 isoform X2 [Pomacea canaliculata]